MGRLRIYITHNWFAKLFSIGLAALLWATISNEANSEIGITTPLEYRNIPSQLEIIGDTTNAVEVRLRGSATLIRQVSTRDISAAVDLTGLPPGEKIVQLTPQHVKLPFGIEVVRLNPSQVRLRLERTLVKTVPVVVRVEGEPAVGFDIGEITVTPATVEVEGPESKVRRIERMPTAAVKIAGTKEGFNGLVDLDLPDPMLRLHYLSPVDVRISIREHHGGTGQR